MFFLAAHLGLTSLSGQHDYFLILVAGASLVLSFHCEMNDKLGLVYSLIFILWLLIILFIFYIIYF